MKKIIIILFIISIGFILYNKDSEIIIPEDSIRFRVIANSNSLKDQNEKIAIKKEVEKKVYDLIKEDTTINEVRYTLKNHLNEVENIIKDHNINYNINYGNNYFPAKTYKDTIYPAGDYESLVITLGEGLGENFWCVLFPPLCLIDENANTSDTEYELYINKLLSKF